MTTSSVLSAASSIVAHVETHFGDSSKKKGFFDGLVLILNDLASDCTASSFTSLESNIVKTVYDAVDVVHGCCK
jgi:hypothetical protein